MGVVVVAVVVVFGVMVVLTETCGGIVVVRFEVEFSVFLRVVTGAMEIVSGGLLDVCRSLMISTGGVCVSRESIIDIGCFSVDGCFSVVKIVVVGMLDVSVYVVAVNVVIGRIVVVLSGSVCGSGVVGCWVVAWSSSVLGGNQGFTDFTSNGLICFSLEGI